MKLGMTLTASVSPGHTSREAVQHCVWAARHADEAGFGYVWTTEHHFTEVAHTGAPSAILAHYAAITERVKLGYAVAIVPFHHPLRLAEEISWVDNLSNGRVVGGISPGWAAYEFAAFGVPLEERRARLEEGWEVLQKALTGDTFSHDGTFWNIPEARVLPPPVQQPVPFVMSTSSDESVVRAAQWKVGSLLGLRPLPLLAKQRELYIDTCRNEGYSEEEITELVSRMGVLRRIIITKTDEEGEDEALKGGQQFRESQARLLTLSGTDRPVENVIRSATGVMTKAADVDLRETAAYTGTIAGTVETVTEKLLELNKIGIGHVLCGFGTKGTGFDDVKESIRLFSKEVLPVVHAAG